MNCGIGGCDLESGHEGPHHVPEPPVVRCSTSNCILMAGHETEHLFNVSFEQMRALIPVPGRPVYYGGHDNVLEHKKVALALGWDKRAFVYNATKYLWRLGAKPGAGEIDDLKKAIVYLQFEVERLEGG